MNKIEKFINLIYQKTHNLPKIVWVFVLVILLGVYIFIYIYNNQAWRQQAAIVASHLKYSNAAQSGAVSNLKTTDLSQVDLISSQVDPVTGQVITVGRSRGGVPAPILYLGSFGYSYQNIDQSKTSLYFNETSKTISFPPDYELLATDSATSDKNYFNSLSLNNFNGPYNDKRCLGSNCLEQRGNDLYYNDKLLVGPSELKGLNIAAVSISFLTKRWLVGYTLKEGDKYRALVFYFDGRQFSLLKIPQNIESNYFGLCGFGGTEDDFIVIYGAYQGLAYHIINNEFTDISKFFSIMVMNNGFKPEIIRVANNADINWYIFSSSANRPILIKLWQNKTTQIVGENTFPEIFPNNIKFSLFKLAEVSKDKISLLSRFIDRDGGESFQLFIDRGFKNELSGELTTNSLPNSLLKNKFIIKKLVKSYLDSVDVVGQGIRFLFSANGQDWQDLPQGENLDFSSVAIENYWLKITYPGEQDKFYSPSVSSINFDYFFEKPSSSASNSTSTEALNSSGNTPGNILNDVAGNAPDNVQNNIPDNSSVNALNLKDLNSNSNNSINKLSSQKIPDKAIRLEVSAKGFSPAEFRVKAHESVTLAITSTDTSPHVFIFPNSNLIGLTTMILGGETKIVNFVAPNSGTYNFRDDLPNLRNNMGKMIVD